MPEHSAVPDRIDLHPGDKVERYEVLQKLGEGTYGIVYKVREVLSGYTYALKVLKLWGVSQKDRDNLSKRFKLEFETGRIASDNLVKSEGYGYFRGNPFILMEYCPNGSLRECIKAGMTEAQIRQYTLGVLTGLGALHSNGKTHRDLKPENVLLDSKKAAKLTDFGIVGHANTQLTVTNWRGKPVEVFGTYAYMSPEQIDPKSRKQTILPTIDIFAFGVLCYELFTGKYPFGKLQNEQDLGPYMLRVNTGKWDDPVQYRPDIHEDWIDLIDNCLKADYRNRYQNTAVILQKLGTAQAHIPQPISLSTGRLGLMIMQGEEHGKVYDLVRLLGRRDFGVLKIGRYDVGVSNDLPILEEHSSYISRAHATLEKQADQWFIRDGQNMVKNNSPIWLTSLNGTYLNGVEVFAEERKRLHINDIITVGNTTLKVVVL